MIDLPDDLYTLSFSITDQKMKALLSTRLKVLKVSEPAVMNYILSKRSGLWGIVVKRFEFNRRSRLGTVKQTLSR